MNLHAEIVNNVCVIRVCEDRLDAAVAVRFKDAMRELTLGVQGRVILDLGEVTFLDSSGLGALVAVMKSLLPDTRMDLAAPQANVSKVLGLTRMNAVFAIYPDTSAALACGQLDAG